MRVGAAVLLGSIAVCSPSFADECPTANWFIKEGLLSFEQHSTVYYQFDQSTTDAQRRNMRFAFEAWTNALDDPDKLNITFEDANGMHEANITISNETLPRHSYGGSRPTHFSPTGHVDRSTIVLDMNQIIAGPGDVFAGIERLTKHEIAHLLGLDHPPEEQEKGSILNRPSIGDPNDVAGWMPNNPTKCDKDAVQRVNKLTPRPRSDRPGPPRAPGSLCDRCGYTAYDIWIADDRLPDGGRYDTVMVETWCCGTNSLNLFPRPSLGPSLAFIATGYQCSIDGWLDVRRGCYADLCCGNPEDVPPGTPTVVPGTTCSAQSWWEADQRAACEASVGHSMNDPVCVKKEVCGGGQCVPWPNYCWKPPYVPHPDPDPDPDPDPEPSGVSCSSKGWYDGDDLGGCERDHGNCERKQRCDGQQCLPDPPGYCWQPN